jgi:hypothetical protein
VKRERIGRARLAFDAGGILVAVLLAQAGSTACWVEQIHIEPDGWDAGEEDAGDVVETEDVAVETEVETTDVRSECGNGTVEAGEECDGDAPRSCITTCGSTGSAACGGDCRWSTTCQPPVESCNAEDDDCDTAVDEDFGCIAGDTRACSDGACAGTQSCAAPACTWGACDVGPAPVNDTCGGALDITAGGVFPGSTCGGGNDHDPAAACGAGGLGRDVWYTFTLTGREVVYLDTVDGNAWNTVLQIRWGGCPAAGTPVVCSDDACPADSGGRRSQIVEVLDAGTYFVVVDGADAAAAGAFALRFQHAGCAEARVLPGNGNYDGTTSGRGDSYVSSCGGGSAAPDVLYYFGLCGPRTVTASTCNASSGFDSVLSFSSGGCDVSHEVACNDDDPSCTFGGGRSTVTADLPQGLNFLIIDGRRAGPGGSYRVNVSGI